MWTHPLYRADKTLHAFEIRNSTIWIGTIAKVLRGVEGVTDVRLTRENDDRVAFLFHGEPHTVEEPWADSSRYLIGAKNPNPSAGLDLAPMMNAFVKHRGPFYRLRSLLSRSALV